MIFSNSENLPLLIHSSSIGTAPLGTVIDPWTNNAPSSPVVESRNYSIGILEVFSFVNLTVQLVCIIYILWEKLLKRGSFFIMLFIQSVAVLFRVVFWIISFYLAVFFHSITPKVPWLEPLIKLSVYVDYCSNLFSVTFNFVLSLNRVLTFMSKKWNTILFDGPHLVFTVIFAIILSVSGAIGMIIPSKVEREFIIEFGFLDTAPDIGFMTAINRFFNVFLIGSIICYIILFSLLRKQNKLVLRKSRLLREGENRIFALLLITTFLYLALFAVFEFITIQDWNDGNGSLLGKWLKVKCQLRSIGISSYPLQFGIQVPGMSEKLPPVPHVSAPPHGAVIGPGSAPGIKRPVRVPTPIKQEILDKADSGSGVVERRDGSEQIEEAVEGDVIKNVGTQFGHAPSRGPSTMKTPDTRVRPTPKRKRKTLKEQLSEMELQLKKAQEEIVSLRSHPNFSTIKLYLHKDYNE